MTTVMTREQIADVLDEAAQYLRDHGWTQRAMFRGNNSGQACAMGAIKRTCEERSNQLAKQWIESEFAVVRHTQFLEFVMYRPAAPENALANYLETLGFDNGIAQWNDREDATATDVIAHLEKAAAWVREQAD